MEGGNHFSSRLYNGLKRPLFRTADGKLYFHKRIYCAVLVPPVSIGLKKGSFKIELLSWLIQNNFPLWGKVFITESGPNRRSRVFQSPSPHSEGAWGACVWLPPASPFWGEVFVFRGVLNGSPAMEHNPFIAVLGSGLAYITIASSGPHKISREVSIAWKHPVFCEERRDRQ